MAEHRAESLLKLSQNEIDVSKKHIVACSVHDYHSSQREDISV